MPRRSFRTADAHTSESAPRWSRSTFGTVAKSSLCLSLLWQPPLEKGALRSELVLRIGSHASCSAHRFRNNCKEAGKEIMVWTVNEAAHMMEVRLIFFVLDVI
jgi:hypothetical protein